MENIINYYYNVVINKIENKDNYYLITINNEKYILSEIFESIESFKNILDYLNNTDILYHLVIMTKDNELFFEYDNKKYCLMKIRIDLDKKTNPLSFRLYPINGICNWGKLWSDRIDYYERQLNEVVKDNEIKYAMNYYISLTENAIQYYNNLEEIYDKEKLLYSLNHLSSTSFIDPIMFYNPVNIISDLSIRDLAEYLKLSFFEDLLTESEILNIIDNIEMDNSMANYFLCRLLYPSYFFKYYDDYIETKEINERIYLYLKKSSDYESLLTKIYNRLTYKYEIKCFMWIFKVQH